ncbi:hypothetical protein CDEST_06033 [Colletotrichum destructivum]|uniref:Uncharacterized protein n=1 Tax=Colletotrichum destructivum TaxID=34406 RepID=A0AAX4ICD8_9PEZI|nr:hypothetical protein CDEST_06033 [Colletotrichum destructivum]
MERESEESVCLGNPRSLTTNLHSGLLLSHLASLVTDPPASRDHAHGEKCPLAHISVFPTQPTLSSPGGERDWEQEGCTSTFITETWAGEGGEGFHTGQTTQHHHQDQHFLAAERPNPGVFNGAALH